MAYVRKRQTIRLQFEDDHDLAGLEVRTRRMSSEEVLDLVDAAGDLAELQDQDTESLSLDDLRQLRARLAPLIETFARVLVEWNMQQETETGANEPVPATLEGVKSLDFEELVPLIAAWAERAAGPGRELGKDSSSGPKFPEVLLPTEPLSQSLASYAAPGSSSASAIGSTASLARSSLKTGS